MDYERHTILIYETIFRSKLYKNYKTATPESFFEQASKFIYWLYKSIFKNLIINKNEFNEDEKFFLVQYLCGIVTFVDNDYTRVLEQRNGSRIRNTDNINKFFTYYNKFKNSTDNIAKKYTKTMIHRRSSRRRSL